LVIHLALLTMTDFAEWATQFAMASSGLWWYGFAFLTFKWVPEPPIENEMESLGIRESASLAFSEIKKTISERNKFRTLFIYMVAYFFFIDGINTVTALGGIFGTIVLGITAFDLMITIVAIQFVAAPSAILFTRLAKKIGTKKALTMSLVGWVVLCFAALSFAPLELESHDEYQIQFDWDEEQNVYTVQMADDNVPQLAQKLQYDESEFNEQAWARKWSRFLPVEIDHRSDTMKWTFYETNSDGEDVTYIMAIQNPSVSDITALLSSMDESRFSASISGGSLDSSSNIGVDHPTSLGDGKLDAIPEVARDKVWQPLGLAVGFQFLLLGCAMGTLLGGSQGLARSMFGQIVPETRSAEFFGFFGFFGKVAALIGPLLYGTLTIMYDSRVGILSISVLILIGAVMMRLVDIDQGRLDAQEEDARNRGLV
jgi:MFS-type transporter involved in bile tolerance (Atg22 family)